MRGRAGGYPQASDDADEEEADMTDSAAQPQPGYREATAEPADWVTCRRCGALVAQTDADLHDRFHLSVEQPVTLRGSSTRGG